MQAAGGAPLSAGPESGPAPDPAPDQEPGQKRDQGPVGSAVGPLPRRRVGVLLAVGLAVLVLDVATKLLAVAQLSEREPVEVVDGLLSLRLVRNPGAAFGVAQGLTVVLTVIAVVVVLVILRIARRLRSGSWAVGLGMVLGGAIGNLVDRVFREPGLFRGHVVDFLELPHWPVFNLADTAIVTGGLLLVLLSVRGTTYDGSRPAG